MHSWVSYLSSGIKKCMEDSLYSDFSSSTPEPILQQKQKIREKVIDQLKSLQGREIKSCTIQKLCLDIMEGYFQKKQIQKPQVCVYAGVFPEVETRMIIQELLNRDDGVWIPRCAGESLEICKIRSWDDLVPGKYSIPEPGDGLEVLKKYSFLDLVIVPGVGFDEKGCRIGRGKGYYDRFLARLDHGILKLGLAFGVQILNSVPVTGYDKKVDGIVTENGLIGPVIENPYFGFVRRKEKENESCS